MRGEQHPVTMVAQASALLDLGFATPPSAPAVGTLVDHPPARPTSAPVAAPPAAAPARPSELPRWAMWAGGGAVALLVATAVAALVRRRARR
jgi:D-alanyl-D-alanine carboxypeptidase (penicillin-binding protein 5/6)